MSGSHYQPGVTELGAKHWRTGSLGTWNQLLISGTREPGAREDLCGERDREPGASCGRLQDPGDRLIIFVNLPELQL